MPQQKRAKKDRSYSHEPRVYAPDQNNTMLQIQSMIKLLTLLRTAYVEELNLKKDVTSYDDLLDSLRLSLKVTR
jgi:hypothetical protein